MSFIQSISKIFGGNENKKTLKKYESVVLDTASFAEEMKNISTDGFPLKTKALRERILTGETLDAVLPEAFALVREASKRTLGERHFDVQIMGGAVLHSGKIAEMRTGEGKTLVATLPAYLNALSGEGVHVVTVNDYLSRRDGVWMGQIYSALGLKVGVITSDGSYIYDPEHQNINSKFQIPNSKQITNSNIQTDKQDPLDKERDQTGSFHVVHEFLRPVERKEAYLVDITYGTNNEFGFDYLRDNLEYEKEKLRQRGFNYAIVDEIDSILIDEARTPLIISSQTGDSEKIYTNFSAIVRDFEEGKDYTVDEKFKTVILTPEGIEKTEKKLGIENIYTDVGVKYVHHLELAVRAKAIFHKDKEYVVKDGQIIIVDEFTGRLQPGRRWSEGLHQAIEAKEGVNIQKESRTFASITFQNYFRLYKKLCGMTGTALTSKEEFYKVYGLDVIELPTNKPIQRIDRNDLIFQSENGKFMAVANKVKELNQRGQPVLIGTVSIEKNESLSQYLSQVGVKHEVLNAKNHEREGEIIAQAGRKSGVTVATNMAGRGVDIKLGGNPATKEEYEEVRRLGGLFVLGTERHEARRIDNQLRGRSGRQGDPGETQFFVSLEDSLVRIFAKDIIKRMMGRLGLKEDEPIENGLITRSLETAQTKIEGLHFDSRKHILEYDDVLNHQRKIVYDRRRKMLLGNDDDVEEYLEKALMRDDELSKKIEGKRNEVGDERFFRTARRLILQTIDLFWVDHLDMMDHLRSSVNLRAYGQRDPLVEYKREGLSLFKKMEEDTMAQVVSILPNLAVGSPSVQNVKPIISESDLTLSGGSPNSAGVVSRGHQHSSKILQGVVGGVLSGLSPNTDKVGRNDLCFCGSGKKYKRCHGK